MEKNCRLCSRAFTILPEDFAFYDHMQVPPPTACPVCRAQRRMAWWNEHHLYRKKDAHDGKEVFSTYPEHAPIKVYEHDYWWSDQWNPMAFGKDYNPSRSFFDQMEELLHEMPRSSREIKTLVNSDYSDNSNNLKNCYLCFDASYCDDLMYCIAVAYCKNTLDTYQAAQMELCYEMVQCYKMYESFFSNDCENGRDVWLSRDCNDCEHVFGCANLRHKKYYIFNVPYTKEEYEKRIIAMNLGSYAALRQAQMKAREVWLAHPYKYMHGKQNDNCVGDYIENGKNVYRSFQVDDSSDIRYCQRLVRDNKFMMDVTNWGDGSEYVYEGVVCGENNRNVKFCAYCWPANSDIEYCMSCHSSSNLFGCIGMRKQEYCILNKKYAKEEYQNLRAKIIDDMKTRGEYGEFFPTRMSPLAYNETVAVDYFPLTKEEAIAQGFRWQDPEAREYKITMTSIDLPDNISEVDDSITKAIIGCATCKRAYRILDRELDFYKRFVLPLPRLCHHCRYTERLTLRTPPTSYHTVCMKCGQSIETSFAPERREIIYCEPCYNQALI